MRGRIEGEYEHQTKIESSAVSGETIRIWKLTGSVDPATIPQFPTSQCLMPEQVYDINSVGEEQQAHLATCPWCKNMMVAAQPSNEEFEEICRKARSASKARHRHESAAV